MSGPPPWRRAGERSGIAAGTGGRVDAYVDAGPPSLVLVPGPPESRRGRPCRHRRSGRRFRPRLRCGRCRRSRLPRPRRRLPLRRLLRPRSAADPWPDHRSGRTRRRPNCLSARWAVRGPAGTATTPRTRTSRTHPTAEPVADTAQPGRRPCAGSPTEAVERHRETTERGVHDRGLEIGRHEPCYVEKEFAARARRCPPPCPSRHRRPGFPPCRDPDSGRKDAAVRLSFPGPLNRLTR